MKMKNAMLMIIAILFIGFTSCKKEVADNKTSQGEITFSSTEITDFEKKGGDFNKDGEVPCDTPIDYAIIWINGQSHLIPAFVLNGMIVTQSLKLDVGTYSVDDFFLMNNGPDGNQGTTDDLVVKASAHAGSDYAAFATLLLPLEFTVSAFTKIETHVEVFCLEETDITAFGFNYWSAWEITVRQEYFFGDICVVCPADYAGSDYSLQSGGLLVDNAAITKVDLYVNNVYVNSTDNTDVYGEGVVCVNYPDRLGEVDNFEFMVYVWLPSGTSFNWVYQYSYFTTDDIPLNSGSDNVNEFVLGNCLFEGSEVNLPQYANLPTNVDFSISTVGTLGGYFDLTFSGIDPGFIIDNITYPGFCAQNTVYITPGTIYTGNIFSTLDIPKAILNTDLTELELKKLHFLVNFLDGVQNTINLNALTTGDGSVIQNVIWSITDGVSLNAGNATTIANAINAGYSNYNPLPNEDQKFLVVVYHSDNTQLQIMNLDICP